MKQNQNRIVLALSRGGLEGHRDQPQGVPILVDIYVLKRAGSPAISVGKSAQRLLSSNESNSIKSFIFPNSVGMDEVRTFPDT